jgi:hypothetical protein
MMGRPTSLHGDGKGSFLPNHLSRSGISWSGIESRLVVSFCSTLAVAAVALYAVDGGTTELKKELATVPDCHRRLGDRPPAERANHSLDLPDADESVARTYRAPDGRRVNLYCCVHQDAASGEGTRGNGNCPASREGQRHAFCGLGEDSVPVNRTFLDQKPPTRPGYVLVSHQRDELRRSQSGKAGDDQTGRSVRGRTDGALVMVSTEPRKRSERGSPGRRRKQFCRRCVSSHARVSPMKMRAALTIRVVTSLEEFKGLTCEWDRVAPTGCQGTVIFLTWEWLYYWSTALIWKIQSTEDSSGVRRARMVGGHCAVVSSQDDGSRRDLRP